MDLAELVLTGKGDRSYDDLETDCGGVPGSARLQQIATNPLRGFPEPETIRGMARGLRVNEATVVLAAAESLGLNVRQQSTIARMMPNRADHLTKAQVAAVLGVVNAMIDPAGTRTDDLAARRQKLRPPQRAAARTPDESPPPSGKDNQDG